MFVNKLLILSKLVRFIMVSIVDLITLIRTNIQHHQFYYGYYRVTGKVINYNVYLITYLLHKNISHNIPL